MRADRGRAGLANREALSATRMVVERRFAAEQCGHAAATLVCACVVSALCCAMRLPCACRLSTQSFVVLTHVALESSVTP